MSMKEIKNSSVSGAEKVTAIVVILALAFGLVSGLVGSFVFANPGAQGEQGIQGIQGEVGPQGIQGEVGPSGSNAVIQIIQGQNVTPADLRVYALDQWYNLSAVDGSMRMTINLQSESRICAEFLSSVSLSSGGAVSLRVVVDNQFNSTICNAGISGFSANWLDLTLPVQVKILTDALSIGEHTIEVQFLRSAGAPVILERAIYVTEIAS